MFLLQSLRARMDKSVIKDVENQSNRVVVKEVLSFALSEKVWTNILFHLSNISKVYIYDE